MVAQQNCETLDCTSSWRRVLGEVADGSWRALLEELRAEISDPVQIGILENIFTYSGQAGHEFVVVFDAEFTDSSLYDEPTLPLFEEVWGGEAFWRPLQPQWT